MNRAKQWYSSTCQSWREVAAEDHFMKVFWANLAACFVVFMLIVQWLKYNSTRHGTVINDPVYSLFGPYDFSYYISFFTYTAAIIAIVYMMGHPQRLHRALTGFVIVFLLRAICIFLIPLSPSGDLIILRDPFTDFMANEQSITNDLFFSGHVADIVFFYFIVENVWLRRYLFVCAVMVAVLLVLQHVHYTLDVIAAPVFTYFCYWAIVEKDFIWGYFLKKPADEKNAHSPAA